MHTAVFSDAVACAKRFTILWFTGSARCSLASPWQAWHMLPMASFLAPWNVVAIEACASRWHPAQTGVGGSARASCGCHIHHAAARARMPNACRALRAKRPHALCMLRTPWRFRAVYRSEEHTSELQSQFHLVCRLLLEKKKKIKHYNSTL